MAKKKTARRKTGTSSSGRGTKQKSAQATAKKPTTTTKPTTKKSTSRKTAASKRAPKKAATKKAPRKVTRKKPSATNGEAARPAGKKAARKGDKAAKSLGRPRIPGDAKVDSVFRKEYDARQLCEFLGVRTLRELEQYEPEEIIQKMMAPVVQTVGKIRKILAVANRSLASDEAFAIEFRELYGRHEEE